MEIAQLIFAKWSKETADEGVNRFLYKGRTERLEMLVEELKQANVSLEDALSLKRKVPNSLVTKEGKKGSGKHKGWVQSVEEEYEGIVASIYEDQLVVAGEKKSTVTKMLPKSSLITSYCKYKYSDFYTEEIEKSVRTFGTLENTLFMEEIDKGMSYRQPWVEG